MSTADSTDVELELRRLLDEFQQDLAIARRDRDISFEGMQDRLNQLVRTRVVQAIEVTGSSSSFNKLLKARLDRPPRRTLLRGFLLALDATAPELAAWEQRRQDLVRLQLHQRTAERPADEPHAQNGPEQLELDRQEEGSADMRDPPAEAVFTPTLPGVDSGTEAAATEPGALELASGAGRLHRRRKAIALFIVGLVVVLTIEPFLAWRGWIGAQTSDLQSVAGQARCNSGAEVAGVFIAVYDGSSSSRWAQWTPDPTDVAHASFAGVVPAGARYAVHVGCGRDGSEWRTDNWSPSLSGDGHALLCDDQIALNQKSHYGTCRAI